MEHDIRGSEPYRTAEEFFRRSMGPGLGRITAAAEPAVRADGRAVAVTGTVFERLEGGGHTRIAVADEQGLRVVTDGPGDDRCLRWSPGGDLAFLSDRAEDGAFALHLLRDGAGEAAATPHIDGTGEYCAWSPDGRHVLIGVAGRGADLAAGHGSGTTKAPPGEIPAWYPEVSGGPAAYAWRSLWLYDVERDEVSRITADGMNVWEAAWLGPELVVAVVSNGDPSESAWYTANLAVIAVAGGAYRTIYEPRAQLGWPAGSPRGGMVAVVEAVCSDRWLVAGDVRLIDPGTGSVRTLDTAGVDVSGLQWIDERRLGYAGVRGLETVVGWYDTESGTRTELLCAETTSGRRYPEATFAPDGTTALVLEGHDRPPVVTLVGRAGTTALASLAHPGTDWLRTVAGTARPYTWRAPDGLEIEGVLCLPAGDGPFPLVVMVHGGPVWSQRSRWLLGNGHTPLLVSRGFAVLHPNPRGSSGRGQEFARAVVGDMGGADAHDILAGIDALVADGLADPPASV